MNYLKSFSIEPGQMPDLRLPADQAVVLLHSNRTDGRNFLAVGEKRHVQAFVPDAAIDSLQGFLSEKPSWCFGVMAYELGNSLVFTSGGGKQSFLDIPQLYFFEPRNLVVWQNDRADIVLAEPGFEQLIEDAFKRVPTNEGNNYKPFLHNPQLIPAISKDEYLSDVKEIMKAIQHGDVYELNYCFALEGKGEIDPWQTWLKLNELTEAPFSGFLQLENNVLLCGSPERFICRDGNTLCSQPIKGTRKRGVNPEEDYAQLKELRSDPKERAENIMITDLVRNDLSRLAIADSVRVEELCAVKSYKTVHQMVSTICAEVHEHTLFKEIVDCTFPMGSMTGAPKASAMQLIARYERSPRGWYSGSMGWIDPDGNFDFNVIIRSIHYNRSTRELRAGVGSAVTATCQPEKEWEECELKARALVQSLEL
jgi:para-aminobenzoate synthetase component 1